MKIVLFFPDFYTEAHQTPEKGKVLVELFERHGIFCTTDYNLSPQKVDAVFCGSFMKNQHLRGWLKGESYPNLKVFHYSWDIYPFQLQGLESPYPYWSEWWKQYVEDCRACEEVFIPSLSCEARMQDYCGRKGFLVYAPAHTWEEPVWQGNYVLDCVRKYPDPNRNAVAESCERLNIPCVESRNRLSWDEYKRTVAGCRFMASAQYEASTGGLSLLEGYALGKPVLVSDSSYHGGKEYFGPRCSTFTWGEPASLDNMISNLWKFTGDNPNWKPPECREWVESTYNDERFVREIAEIIKERL